MNSSQYFLKRAEKVHGPYAQADIQKLYKSSKIKPDDLLSGHKDGPWQPLAKAIKSTPEPASKHTVFFVQLSGKTHGPYTPLQIKKLEIAGKLSLTDQLATSKDGPWKMYGISKEDVAVYVQAEDLARLQADRLAAIKGGFKESVSEPIPSARLDVITKSRNDVDAGYELADDADLSDDLELPDDLDIDHLAQVEYAASIKNLTKCQDCLADISTRAETCPQCGAPTNKFDRPCRLTPHEERHAEGDEVVK